MLGVFREVRSAVRVGLLAVLPSQGEACSFTQPLFLFARQTAYDLTENFERFNGALVGSGACK